MKSKKHSITILTPTYNRVHTLNKLYESLCKQTNKNFEWMVIDDGSNDNTEELILKFIEQNKIKIKYFKKKNGGKHTAINFGLKNIKSEYVFILDSDDFLSNDAIQIMNDYILKYQDNKGIACFSFLKAYTDKTIVGKKHYNNETISNNIDFRYNQGYLGDMAELFKTSILKKYPFPEFAGEKFLSECYVWNNIALKYNTVYINKIIYYCEYLDDGLSKGWFKQVVNSPKGARLNSMLFMNKKFIFKIRLKNCIEYGVFSFLSNSRIMSESKMKFFSIVFYIPCFIISLYLKKKYKEKL